MNNILLPELYESENFYKHFKCDDISDLEEKLTCMYRKYPHAILDAFKNALTIEESSELLNSSFFKLKQEEKYIKFINKCFDNCKQTCYIDIQMDFRDEDNFMYYFPLQDTIDKYLYLNLFNRTIKKSNFYKICDNNLLNFFIKNGLREQMHYTIYFKDIEMLMFSNYDLSLPIIFKSDKFMDNCESFLEEDELYFRDKVKRGIEGIGVSRHLK